MDGGSCCAAGAGGVAPPAVCASVGPRPPAVALSLSQERDGDPHASATLWLSTRSAQAAPEATCAPTPRRRHRAPNPLFLSNPLFLLGRARPRTRARSCFFFFLLAAVTHLPLPPGPPPPPTSSANASPAPAPEPCPPAPPPGGRGGGDIVTDRGTAGPGPVLTTPPNGWLPCGTAGALPGPAAGPSRFLADAMAWAWRT